MHAINWTYAAIMLTAIITLSLLLRRSQAKLALAWWQKLGLGIGGFCGASIGSKLPFAFYEFSQAVTPTVWLSDGKTIMCGIVGGYFGVEISKWVLEIRTKTGDTFAAPVAVAVAIGRIGCFHGGCCFGAPTKLPWGMKFPTAPDGGVLLRHPTQLYETTFHLFAAGLLLWFGYRGWFKGQLVKLYILAYLGYRFLSEFLRPEPEFYAGLTAYQWACLALAPIFLALWWWDHKTMKRGEGESIVATGLDG